MPNEILGDDYDIIKSVLEGYQKVRETIGWDKYAEKLSLSTREMLASKFKTLRYEGFFNPHIESDKIIFGQLSRQRDYIPDIDDGTWEVC